MAAGDIRFLQKPFDMDTLARELRAVLDKSAT
jgi:DNA-binding response OmpR family regulator